jgi:glycosyltransferase involved in cell wall biosynthesis
MIGPRRPGGSIPPYLTVFSAALRRLGAHVDWIGSSGVPYDRGIGAFWPASRIIRQAHLLLRDTDLNAYDILSVHFGNLDIEQVIPCLWGARHPPAVYHVHSLAWTLFSTYVPDPGLHSDVGNGVRQMDGFVFFGSYAADRLATPMGTRIPSVTSWLPTTVTPGTRRRRRGQLAAALSDGRTPLGSLYGYAAPWKDPASLIAASRQTTSPNRVIVCGPLWDDPTQAGLDLTAEIAGAAHGATRMRVIPCYLGARDRLTLVAESDFGVFPYRTHPSFQGSGAIADYLAQGVPVLATDVANMAEVVGNAGIMVPSGDPESLASAMERLACDTRHRAALTDAARDRARRFSAVRHAAECLRFYEIVAAHRPRTTGAQRCRLLSCLSPGMAKHTATGTTSWAGPEGARG